MAIEQTAFLSNLVIRDTVKTWRWYDAFGPNVVKVLENFVSAGTDDTTGDLNAYTHTVVEVGAGDSTAVLTTTKGGALLMTCAGNENDGVQIQLKGEAFQLNVSHPCYFGIELAVNDADQVDALVGLCITDTTAIAALSDGAYFRTVDESATLQFVIEKNSVESATNVATLVDATKVVLEWYYDGTNITAYVNGVQVAQIANTDASFPDDEVLTPTIALLTGEATANTMTVEWMRAIQVQN